MMSLACLALNPNLTQEQLHKLSNEIVDARIKAMKGVSAEACEQLRLIEDPRVRAEVAVQVCLNLTRFLFL